MAKGKKEGSPCTTWEQVKVAQAALDFKKLVPLAIQQEIEGVVGGVGFCLAERVFGCSSRVDTRSRDYEGLHGAIQAVNGKILGSERSLGLRLD